MLTSPASICRAAIGKVTAPDVAPWVGFGCAFVAFGGLIIKAIVTGEWRPDGDLGRILFFAIFIPLVPPRLSALLTVTILFLTALLFVGDPLADNLGLIVLLVAGIVALVRRKEFAAEARAAEEGG